MLFISTTITSPKQAKRDVRAAMMTYPSISWQKYSFLPYLIKYLAFAAQYLKFDKAQMLPTRNYSFTIS
jgi:hypothetical protein